MFPVTLYIFSVSVFGSFGAEAHSLLAEVSRRCGRRIPTRLLDLASWATPQLAGFARMAVGLAARRGPAEMVGRLYRRADIHADLDDIDGDGPPADHGGMPPAPPAPVPLALAHGPSLAHLAAGPAAAALAAHLFV